MIYDSLLLNNGGGIINNSQKSEQYRGSAALCIGIGGTGVAALQELKRKVYQQLEPDDPNSPIPTYQHIQFLAIDSDETDIARQTGKSRLDKNAEFFSVKNGALADILATKEPVKNNPCMNWMDIDHISALLNPMGAGGIRQVGRFLLISKAGALYNKIQEKCNTALSGAETPSLDVYIFAGISGGTGSGCFLDTCYIVRQVLNVAGLGGQSKIMGFFFLPDVVTSKPEVAAEKSTVTWNNNNGYAALKELDYLMDLKQAGDRFHQNYGAFTVDTDEPPVDMCHLLSAKQSDGKVIPNGFGYCINVAADYVMSYLAKVELGQAEAGNDGGLTMRGHLANVTNGVSVLPRLHGANLSYHVLGASNAEIPMSQISTYLAAGFYQKFQSIVSRDKVALTSDDVKKKASNWGLTASKVKQGINQGCSPLILPDIEMGELAAYGVRPKANYPQPWGTGSGMAWEDKCSGQRQKNRTALNGKLESYDVAKVTKDSYVGRIFADLVTWCKDPDYGPYYAASVLSHSGHDLLAEIDGIIKELHENAGTAETQLEGNSAGGGAWNALVQASTDFCEAMSSKNPIVMMNRKKYYDYYKQAAERTYQYSNQISTCNDAIAMLRTLKEDLQELRKSYFDPLITMLDNLNETFREDLVYLNGKEAKKVVGYTWRIMELAHVRQHLDDTIEKLTPNQLVRQFMEYFLADPAAWQDGDDGKITLLISKHMQTVFNEQMNKSIQNYLFEKYPEAKGDPDVLAQYVQTNVIQEVYNRAMPMFWCDPTYDLVNESFRTNSLSVPSSASAICNAADNFVQNRADFKVRKTGLKDRIFALRFCSGIPCYTYQGIVELKKTYDAVKTAETGVGAHLYAKTGRGEDGSGEKDWRNFLPTPVPYSSKPEMVDQAEKKIDLYQKGIKSGAIRQDPTGTNYQILQSRAVTIPTYTSEMFVKDGAFQMKDWSDAKNGMVQARKTMYTDGITVYLLKNDGKAEMGNSVVERVRMDYFLHYPKLQQIVRGELEKQAQLDAAIKTLDGIAAAFNEYQSDMETFMWMIFFKLIDCKDSKGRENYKRPETISYTYKDSRGASKTLTFADSRTGQYGKEYPLYQAFLTYRALDANERPRRDLDALAKDRGNGELGAKDNVVGYTLDRWWNGEALQGLERETEQRFSREDRANLLDFYYNMRREIDKLASRFDEDEWTYIPSENPNPSNRVTPTPPPPPPVVPQQPRYLYDPATGHQMQTRPGAPGYALDSTTNQWVLLNTGMQIYNGTTWEPLRLDDNYNILN